MIRVCFLHGSERNGAVVSAENERVLKLNRQVNVVNGALVHD